MVVGRLLSYWEGNFSGAMLNFRRVLLNLQNIHAIWHEHIHQFNRVSLKTGIQHPQMKCLTLYGCQPKNRGIWPPKWMVKIMVPKPYEQMDDLGAFPIFLGQHPYIWDTSLIDPKESRENIEVRMTKPGNKNNNSETLLEPSRVCQNLLSNKDTFP